MKQGWTYKKLKDVCLFQYGYAFDSSQFCDDKTYPQLIRIRDVVRGYSETYYKGEIPEGYFVEKGDYLIGMDGEFNIAPWNSERALLNQRVCKISSSSKDVDNRFIFYSMHKVLKKIEDETPFVTVKHLSAKRLNAVNLNIPTLDEQQQIVAELDLLSGVIEKQKAQLEELDKLAQSIFYDMFGDPVTNEKGWHCSIWDDCLTIQNGKNQSQVEAQDGLYPICGSGGIMSRANDYLCPENTVIIGRKGNIDNPIMMKEKFWIVDTAFGLVSKEQLKPDYLFYFCKCFNFQKLNVAVTIPSLRKTDLLKINMPLPPLTFQQEFAAKVEAIEAMKAKVRQSLKESETLFNSRMDYYFN